MTIKELSRRRFIKSASGLILVPSFQIVRATNFLARPASGSATCPADGSPDISVAAQNDDENAVSISTDRTYVGQKNFSHSLGVAKEVCKLGFYMAVGAGTVSGKKYRASIWTMSGNNLGSMIANGISDEMNGPAAGGFIRFPWSGSKPSLASGTNYAPVVAAYDAGTTNLAAPEVPNRAVVWSDSPSSINGNAAVWSNVGAIDVDSATTDCVIEIYWFD